MQTLRRAIQDNANLGNATDLWGYCSICWPILLWECQCLAVTAAKGRMQGDSFQRCYTQRLRLLSAQSCLPVICVLWVMGSWLPNHLQYHP
jgi:hypothetical protein